MSTEAKLEILGAWMHSKHMQEVIGLTIEYKKELKFLEHLLDKMCCPENTKVIGITDITARKIFYLSKSFEHYDTNVTSLITGFLDKLPKRDETLNFIKNFILNRNTIYPDSDEIHSSVPATGDIKSDDVEWPESVNIIDL